MTAPKPTILFLHGAWHEPSHFATIRKLFEDAGYPTSCPLYPSVEALPPIGLFEDAQCVRDELTHLVDEQGKDVVVVAHSYGGVVMTQAVDQAFAKQTRQKEGKQGGVLHLVYLAAFILPPKTSLCGALGGSPAPFIIIDDQGMGVPNDPINLFYNDLPPSEQQRWAKEIRKCPIIAQQTPLTHTAWSHYPVTYLECENDQALPIAIQRSMINELRTKYDLKVNVETCSAGHSPFLSMPGRVLEVVEKAAIAMAMAAA